MIDLIPILQMRRNRGQGNLSKVKQLMTGTVRFQARLLALHSGLRSTPLNCLPYLCFVVVVFCLVFGFWFFVVVVL